MYRATHFYLTFYIQNSIVANTDSSRANSYTGEVVVIEVKDGRDLVEQIGIHNAGNTKYTRYVPTCAPNESYWLFSVKEPSQRNSLIRLFKDAVIAEQDSRRSAGDDF